MIWLLLVIWLTKTRRIFRKSILGFSLCCVLCLVVQFTPICVHLLKQNPFTWLYNYLFYHSYQRVNVFNFKKFLKILKFNFKILKKKKKDICIDILDWIVYLYVACCFDAKFNFSCSRKFKRK